MSAVCVAAAREAEIKRLADTASTLGALLSTIHILNIEHREDALLNCSSMADDFARDLDAFVGARV